jgi:hypothetical protein
MHDNEDDPFLPSSLQDSQEEPLSSGIKINLPLPITVQSTLKEVQAADVQIANDMLGVMFNSWGAVKTIAGATKLAKATMELVKARRELLNMPYGDRDSANARTPTHLD